MAEGPAREFGKVIESPDYYELVDAPLRVSWDGWLTVGEVNYTVDAAGKWVDVWVTPELGECEAPDDATEMIVRGTDHEESNRLVQACWLGENSRASPWEDVVSLDLREPGTEPW
jgi:hypothetical protein